MTKLNKSIRHAMKAYGPALRNGHYIAVGGTGQHPEGFQTFKSAYADVEDGVASDIRLYAVGDAILRRDHDGDSAEITGPVNRFLSGDVSWNMMIDEIEDLLTALQS